MASLEQIRWSRRQVFGAARLAVVPLLAARFGVLPALSAMAAEVEVAIQSFAFTPAALTVEVGTTVRWVNRDTPSHTATSDTGVWDSSILRPGQSFTFTFTHAGTFPYHCDIHPSMKATITVTAAPAQPAPTPAPTPGPTPAPAPGTKNFADPTFRELWARTDETPGGRTYVWGAAPLTDGLQEAYREAPGGQRLVQYFDKGRMELNQPGGPVTAGLLAVELITGQQQDGDATFTPFQPGRVAVAGDPDNPFPTYADLGRLRARDGANNVAAATPIAKLYRPDGTFGTYAAATTDPLAATTGYDTQTGHNIPRAFNDFRNSPVYGGLQAIGLAYTEPVWVEVKVAGQPTMVLLQAFERRVITYTPSNPTGFKVEYGNIGQGYYRWRYQNRPTTPALEVVIKDLAFMPNALSVPVGATVRWVNQDTRRHTTTSDSAIWDSTVLQPGQSFAFTFAQAGTFPYHCEIHPSMKATITVGSATGQSDPAPAPGAGHEKAHGH